MKVSYLANCILYGILYPNRVLPYHLRKDLKNEKT